MINFVHGDKVVIATGKYGGRSATFHRRCGKSSCIVKLDPHGPVVTIRETSLPSPSPSPASPVPTSSTVLKQKCQQKIQGRGKLDLRTLRQVRDELDAIIKAFENASLD